MFCFSKTFSALALMSALTLSAAPEARAQIATNLKCKKCVGTGDLAKNAVTRSRLKNNAVTGAKVKNGSIELEDLSPAVRQVISDLRAQVAALQALADLAAFITVDEVETDLNGDGAIDPATERLPRILFEGVNVQIVASEVSANPLPNGLGNLIIGHNEPRPAFLDLVCSDGRFDNQNDCEAGGHVWATDHKSGSHNLVVGPFNAYSRTGGVVFGESNVVNAGRATVTGGSLNIASGGLSSVSGGIRNTASGDNSSVSGGIQNDAIGQRSSVSGGSNNDAIGESSSVSGGGTNQAVGAGSSVTGGSVNTAQGTASSISGGSRNTASGDNSSVSGGFFNFATGLLSGVSGGQNETVAGDCDWGGEGTVFGDGICIP